MKVRKMACFALRLSGPAALTVGGLVWLAAVLAAGGSLAGLAAFAGLFFVAVLCAGRFLARLAAPGLEKSANLAVSFCLGLGVLLAGWWALGRLGAWAALAPALVLGGGGRPGGCGKNPAFGCACPAGR